MFTQSEYFPDILICLTLWKVFDSRGCFGQAEKFLHFWRTHVSKIVVLTLSRKFFASESLQTGKFSLFGMES